MYLASWKLYVPEWGGGYPGVPYSLSKAKRRNGGEELWEYVTRKWGSNQDIK
jgi:hypothetical protein